LRDKKLYLILSSCAMLLMGYAHPLLAQNDSIVKLSSEMAILDDSPTPKVHSPHKATFYAAILPGLGQIYNKKYWKLPLVYGGIAGVAYGIHFNSKYYKDYRRAYRDFIVDDPNNTSYVQFIPPGLTLEDVRGRHSAWFQNALQNKKKYYKRYRDMSYIGMGLIYVAQIIDATVDAHFFNFDISDNLSLNVQPAIVDPQAAHSGLGMQFCITF
jgi:hypothetical protein